MKKNIKQLLNNFILNILKNDFLLSIIFISIMDFYISLITGIIQAIIFNPIDKAIYSSIINNNNILSPTNWYAPFSGATNGIYIKIITGGVYYYLIDFTKHLNIIQASICISLITASIINPFNVIRFNSYIQNLSTYNSFRSVYTKYNIKFIIIGIEALICRDFIFNIIYLSFKTNNRNLLYNSFIISCACICSSPFQYIKGAKYYNNNNYYNICSQFYINLKNNDNKINYIIKEFGLGYGTLRSIISVYTGHIMYSYIKQLI